ncbi:hypothetical protein PFISCL1PPCAC_1647, partial [Pristionchus fissidentatus]
GHFGRSHREHFERIREEMIAKREIFDRNLGQLSPEAQQYAIQIREVIEDRNKSGEECRYEIRSIKQNLPQEIRDELDDHRHR